MEQRVLNELHHVLLEILDEFARICEEQELTYFLYAGTLLGAVRHKGFIPWDDDVDIAMPRKDYEKFLDLFRTDSGTNYYVLSNRCPTNSFWHYIPFAKFCKKNTVFMEKNAPSDDCPPGIFIDIFPYDNCIPFLAPLQARLIRLSSKVYRMKTLHNYNKKKKAIFYLIKLFRRFYTLRFAKRLYMKSCTLLNRFKTKYVCLFYNHHQMWKEIQRFSNIFPLTKVEFEKKYYYAPNNSDSFLRVYYGDHMQIPSVEGLITHEPKYIIFDTTQKEKEKMT